MEKRLLAAIIVIATFLLANQGVRLLAFEGDRSAWQYIGLTLLNQSFWYVGVPLVSLLLLHKPGKILREIGLQSNFIVAAKISLISTIPMFLGYGIAAKFQFVLSWNSFLLGAVMAAIGEEVIFRGFLFGQLHRRVGLWFIVAASASAILFGMGHLYQGAELLEMAGVFAVTAIGGIWFSWLFKRWQYNLWVPINFHLLMNLYWSVFEAGSNALGGVEANVYRLLTILISIGLTLWLAPDDEAAEG